MDETGKRHDKGIVMFDAEARAKSGRACGDCQLCCKLVPVASLDKAAGTRCQHQRVGKGCAVYHHAPMPIECDIWSCKWLLGGDTAGMQRPDRVHYVIDAMPDMIAYDEQECMVAQVWVDPAFPLAHRDPGLRAYVALIAKRDKMPTLIRYGSSDAFLLVAPCLASDQQWHESVTKKAAPTQHGMRFLDALAGERA